MAILLNLVKLQPKEGKHCQPSSRSSTSFGLVDRFMGNYSAIGRANSSSGRGKSITPLALATCSRPSWLAMDDAVSGNGPGCFALVYIG